MTHAPIEDHQVVVVLAQFYDRKLATLVERIKELEAENAALKEPPPIAPPE